MRRIILIIGLTVLLYPISVFSQENKNRSEPVTMEEQNKPDLYVVSNRLILKNAPVGKRVEIITIIGNKIREIQIIAADSEYDLNLPRAIYLFRMDGIVKKYAIK